MLNWEARSPVEVVRAERLDLDGWGEDLKWPYPGIPAAVVAEFAAHKVAGLPFFTSRAPPSIAGGPDTQSDSPRTFRHRSRPGLRASVDAA
jgi:hypothetical protein